VGGHCIGIDPFYIAQKAEEAGYHPEIILAGRRMNDGMANWIASQVIRLMIGKDLPVKNSKVLVLGITFKENCPDIRNSKVTDLIHELKKFGCKVDVYDPWADPAEVKHEYGLELMQVADEHLPSLNHYNAIILAVAHDEFKSMDLSVVDRSKVIYDIKALWPKDRVDARL